MRKILLATTALVGFAVAGAAQAATSPLNVTVGGSTDFVAGTFHESKASNPTADRASTSFETIYELNFGVNGKASGFDYGANLSLNNNPDVINGFAGNDNGIAVTNANIFLSGKFGKVQLGDSHGATDLALTAPVVGEGQVYGRYIDFLDTATHAKSFVAGVDGTDHSTNITYFTPKVGNEAHKVQAAVSYVPNFYNFGSNTVQYNDGNTVGYNAMSPYKDVVKGALAYTGAFKPVTLGASAQIITGSSDASNAAQYTWTQSASGKVREFTAWGLGAQAAMDGFTLGANYLDMGHYNTAGAQNKDQDQYGLALKYEFNKIGVGVSYLGGEGYDNTLGAANAGTTNYVKAFNSYGVGGTYTWASGLTTNVDGVMFDQKTDAGVKNDGYVLLVSQKLAF